jgi:hypothetical protein
MDMVLIPSMNKTGYPSEIDLNPEGINPDANLK